MPKLYDMIVWMQNAIGLERMNMRNSFWLEVFCIPKGSVLFHRLSMICMDLFTLN